MTASGKSVCVVGASGLVGSNIVKAALERGYEVRGTLRDKNAPDKAPYLMALPGAAERLTLFSADMAETETFDSQMFGGEMPLGVAAERFVTGDVLVHTWDLAKATGQDATTPGLTVSKANPPSSTVSARPKPRKCGSARIAPGSAGWEKIPSASGCQNAGSASGGTGNTTSTWSPPMRSAK